MTAKRRLRPSLRASTADFDTLEMFLLSDAAR
jgi:hypothetical protein